MSHCHTVAPRRRARAYELPVAAMIFALFAVGAPAVQSADSAVWQQIFLGPVESSMLRNADGSPRMLDPKCTGAPARVDAMGRPTEDGTGAIVQTPTQYSFFVRQGNPRKVVFFADGGGACWDAESCGSLVNPIPGFGGAFSPIVDETPTSLGELGGIGDIGNPDNPYRDFTQVFLPYCSADLFWGSKETVYNIPGLGETTIHHRGADNFLAALEYIKTHKREVGFELRRAHTVSVAGVSAGGYGAQLIFPYVARMTRFFARLTLVSDSAVGIITPDFYGTAIYRAEDPLGTSWGVLRNLPPWVRGLDEGLLAERATLPSSLVPGVFTALAGYRPFARYSSLTTNLDLVQIGFFALQKGADLNSPQAQLAVGLEWYLKAALSLNLTALLPNYRFIIEDGTDHAFVVDDLLTYSPGATGVTIADFIEAQITRGRRGWNSADAGPPSLTP